MGDRIKAVAPKNIAAMTRTSGAQVDRLWRLVDPSGAGHIGAKNLYQLLLQLEIETDLQACSDFIRHVAELRHRDMPEARLPRDRITRGEFLLNRVKLAANPQPTTLHGERVHDRMEMQGVPPKRVANATYGGSDSDKALARSLLDELRSQIRCPGVIEETWKQYNHYMVDHPKANPMKAPTIGLFPSVIETHSHCDYFPHSPSIWNKQALVLKRDPVMLPLCKTHHLSHPRPRKKSKEKPHGWMRPPPTFLHTNTNALQLLPNQPGYTQDGPLAN